ncbi:MAG: DUF4258 domain-containing protein [Lyngbya sp. HA4199-MV5]|jgi:hypothetical protein|nr:DUF4258 domain-containing protein [Lyngbya sp. HA4199-MV5]
MDIEEIIAAIDAGRIVSSRHSLREAAADNLVLGEVYLSVVEGGEMIEEYLNAYPAPACLILGFNTIGEPIHSVWGYDRIAQVARLITVYRPDPNRWLNWRIRK